MDTELKKAIATVMKALSDESSEPSLEASQEVTEIGVMKSVQEDKRLFTAVVLRPNVVDSQGETYDEEVVEKACHDYNEFCSQGNIQHLIQTSLVVPVESWVAKTDFKLGEGEVLKGDWVMTGRIDDDDIWDMCLDGTFKSWSIGCKALVEELE
jgi:hypothetical protein